MLRCSVFEIRCLRAPLRKLASGIGVTGGATIPRRGRRACQPLKAVLSIAPNPLAQASSSRVKPIPTSRTAAGVTGQPTTESRRPRMTGERITSTPTTTAM